MRCSSYKNDQTKISKKHSNANLSVLDVQYNITRGYTSNNFCCPIDFGHSNLSQKRGNNKAVNDNGTTFFYSKPNTKPDLFSSLHLLPFFGRNMSLLFQLPSGITFLTSVVWETMNLPKGRLFLKSLNQLKMPNLKKHLMLLCKQDIFRCTTLLLEQLILHKVRKQFMK